MHSIDLASEKALLKLTSLDLVYNLFLNKVYFYNLVNKLIAADGFTYSREGIINKPH